MPRSCCGRKTDDQECTINELQEVKGCKFIFSDTIKYQYKEILHLELFILCLQIFILILSWIISDQIIKNEQF